MESINRKVLIISLIMAVFTSSLVYVYIKKATSKAGMGGQVQVYVAAKTLPQAYRIEEGDLKQVSIAREYVNPGAVTRKADIVGKRVKETILQGEQIVAERLCDENKAILSYKIPEGKRAVSINVNEQVEVANLIRPGDFVDIIASFDSEEVDNKTNKKLYQPITKIVLQNVEILALGQDQVVQDEKTKEIPKTVTLAVTPEDAEKLVFITEYSRIRMALRPAGDTGLVETSGIIKDDVVPDKGIQLLPK